MYYYGGKGDAERMYFMKYHPATPKVPSRLEVNSIRDGYAQPSRIELTSNLLGTLGVAG